MNRLQDELRRLYLGETPSPAPQPSDSPRNPAALALADALVDAAECTRVLVLQLARPAAWSEIAPLWRAVQVDLDLPAPAIAITGVDALQLWFSLRDAVPVQQGTDFLQALCRQHLGGIQPDRLAIFPDANHPDSGLQGALPPFEVRPQCWSAFVAPDLAPLFDGEPWLDHPPGVEAQAELLSRIESTRPDAFERACKRLEDAAQARRAITGTADTTRDLTVDARTPAAGAGRQGAEQFLLGVMNDPAVPLHLRIEAAKALLPHASQRQRAR